MKIKFKDLNKLTDQVGGPLTNYFNLDLNIDEDFKNNVPLEINIPDELINQKIVVPKIVADYINNEKDDGYTLYGAYLFVDNVPKVTQWIIDGHQEEFAKAWLYGYEVQKARGYYIKDPLTGQYLGKLFLGPEWSPNRYEAELVEENDEMYLEAKRLGYKLVEASSEDNS